MLRQIKKTLLNLFAPKRLGALGAIVLTLFLVFSIPLSVSAATVDSSNAFKYVTPSNNPAGNSVFSNQGIVKPDPNVGWYQYVINDTTVSSARWFLNLPISYKAGTKIGFYVSLSHPNTSGSYKIGVYDNGSFKDLTNVSVGSQFGVTGFYRYYANYTYTVPSNTNNLQFFLYSNTSIVRVVNLTVQVDDASAIILDAQNNTQQILSAIDSTQSAITDNANQNSQNEIDAADKNASDIQANQDANTDKQIQADNDRAEQEKNEIQSSADGASGVSVADNTSGLVDSFKQLVTACSYEGTDVDWRFPRAYIPSISGITPEIELWKEQKIPINDWINKMPSALLKTMQAIITMFLAIYMIRDLYAFVRLLLTNQDDDDFDENGG